ncbi:MAG: hypothetical protein J1F35_03385 [Erysipelotrichales bacterium]|nr:hypothetical protein [Erysipelotrichales bacterium]
MGRKIIYKKLEDITDEYIIEKFWKGKSSTFTRQNNCGHVSEDELKYLNNRFKDSTGPEETIYRIKNKIFERPKCPICGGSIEYRKYGGFKQYCSRVCANKREGFKEQREKTCLERYGTYNVLTLDKIRKKSIKLAHTESAKEKRKQTCLKKYGSPTPMTTKEGIEKSKASRNTKEVKDKIRKTCLERYGVTTPIIQKEILEKAIKNSHTPEADKKRKESMMNRYGVEYSMQIPEILKKCQATNNTPSAKRKREETNLKRYGYKYTCQNPVKQKKANESSQTPEAIAKRVKTNLERFGENNYGNREKAKQTWLDKYGVPHHRMTKEAKEHMSEVMSDPLLQNRRYNKMKENNSFNISKPEDETYNLLKEKFIEVIREYKSELYNYSCDFYIPYLDLYIECNYHWTHGNRPYRENSKEDLEILEKWKSKNTKFYNKAIEVWTIKDVNKRNTAKENNLNWIEFFNIKDFKKWFEDQ